MTVITECLKYTWHYAKHIICFMTFNLCIEYMLFSIPFLGEKSEAHGTYTSCP